MIKQKWHVLTTLGYFNSIKLLIKIILFKLRIVNLKNDRSYKSYNNLSFLEAHHIKYKAVKNNVVLCEKNPPKFPCPSILRLADSDVFVFYQVYLLEEYKPLVDIYQRYFGKSAKVIIDAGSNIGLTATYLASHFPASQIICLEPDDANFKQLRRNAELSNHTNFDLVKKALWSSNQNVSISRHFRDGQSWSIQVSTSSCQHDFVSSISLASIIEEFEIQEIDIMKMDIEGAEREIFSDHEDALFFLSKIKALAIEIHEDVVEKSTIEGVLKKAGFTLFRGGESIFGFNRRFVKGLAI